MLGGLFNDIGNKLKGLARIVAAAGELASFIVGINMIRNDQMWWGLLVIIAGSLVSWLAVCGLYAFGELVHNSTIIANELTEIRVNLGIQPKKTEIINKLDDFAHFGPDYVEKPQSHEGKQGWTCVCGEFNPLYMKTCVCGRDKEGNMVNKPSDVKKNIIICRECGSEEDASHQTCYKCGAKLK